MIVIENCKLFGEDAKRIDTCIFIINGAVRYMKWAENNYEQISKYCHEHIPRILIEMKETKHDLIKYSFELRDIIKINKLRKNRFEIFEEELIAYFYHPDRVDLFNWTE